ncbi:MAG TPA: radical SAM protein [Tenuifilaceae bacterium]|nr:radical SAM protein [Tenuifilaceae bacterium]HOZ16168.1 radical SAM protein [Tenuifilaceae bacterium]HPI46273.1 radical SAM protein [Tenuifilaceae bacterium]HPN23257.1 radical SAM protein [Tenuifilaceae bacterium]HPV57762.1 radical SAM protein [Tenuifilaceae bacterium]
MYFSYDEPLFRPPAEAYSAIIQATLGCSWNRCAFCEMYSSKKFKVRNIDELRPEIETLSRIYSDAKKVFLSDGNAFVLSANKLIPILEEVNKNFGRIQRVSSYAMPRDILSKSDDELKSLKELGLKLLYVGIETGDDELLKLIDKGETSSSTVEGILKAHNAGIETSIMIINGLGGKKYSGQHAVNSAKIINQINPKFLSTLTLSMPYGENHFRSRFQGEYIPLTMVELFEELRTFIGLTDLNNVIYRSNHVSNNLILSGTLSKDKETILEQLDRAIETTPRGVYPTSPGVL